MVLEINETRIVIGPCSHRVIADVKEAGWRVRSQLTVGRISSVGVAVQHIRLSSAKIIGSNPIQRTKYGPIAQLVEQPTLNRFVVGSIPSRSTKIVLDYKYKALYTISSVTTKKESI